MNLLVLLIGILAQTPTPTPNLGGVGTLIGTVAGLLNALTIALAAVAVGKVGVSIMWGGGVSGDDRSINGAISSAKYIIFGLIVALTGSILISLATNQITNTIR